MFLDKIILSCDDSHYKYYWPVVAKTCRKVLKSTPVLFKITDNDSDFYFDGNGLVKNVKAIPNIDTGLQSLFYRMYATKFFQDEVCLISDIDMLLLSEDYFQGTVKNFDENSIVVYTSDAYDMKREDSKKLFSTNVFGMCYNAAKGKIFTDILGLDGSFEDFLNTIDNFKTEKGLEWYGDEVFLTNQIEKYSEKYTVHKLKRGFTEGFVLKDRIEKWHFPVDYVHQKMKIDNLRDGSYDKKLLSEGYYCDCHCIRPYGFYEKEINDIANTVCNKHNLFQTINSWDYSTVNDRCLIDDGDIVDIGCLNWDWSNFFLGKKRIIGVDPFENQIPYTEIFKGVIGNYNGITKMKNDGIASSINNQDDGEEVIVKTWKDFCNEFNIKRISVLKVNIEGAEYDLLDSLTDDDFDNIDQITISFHDWMVPEWKSKTEDSIKLLKSKNYEIQKINESWGWYLAVKKTGRIENVRTDIENELIYFNYYGPNTSADIRITYNGMTAYTTKMEFTKNPDVEYFIGCYNFFNNVDHFFIEINFTELKQTQKIFVNLGDYKENETFNFFTEKTDASFYTFKEVFFDKIYISDKVKVEQNDFVVDIGANYGFFSYQAKAMGARKVVSYEPSKKLQKHLHSNLKHLESEIIQKAVSGISGTLKFQEDEISSASSRLSNSNYGYEVEVIGINELIDSFNMDIDFLKIDCEGDELNIFNKITSDRLNKIKKIVVEYHSEEIKNVINKRLLSEKYIVEKIEKNLIYAYRDSESNSKKKIVLISTFCDTQEKQNVLKENIGKIKELGLDILVISPIELPIELISLCDYFFKTKDNPLLEWPIRMYTHWYEMPITDRKITTIKRGLADYGWAGLYQVKKMSQIALSFDYDIFYHMIYDLLIDDVVVNELMGYDTNIVHPRRDPHHPEILWETTLHFMVFDRPMMEKIVTEIQLDEYLRTDGVAEGEVLKWKNKFGIPTSNHPVKDQIFYWEDYDFFDYSPLSDFKFFISKNEKMNIWLGENPPYETELSDNLRLVFHGFETMDKISIIINGKEFIRTPKEWEIVEIPISSQNIYTVEFKYKDECINFTPEYKKIMFNQIYYNHRP
jgi:FkbM family methyltransferase